MGSLRLLLPILAPPLAALAVAGATQVPEIRVTNTVQYVGAGRHNWTVSLVAPESVLNRIGYVEYTLHPSFPDPVRKVTERQTRFALSSNGWGEFNIQVKVVEKQGMIRYLEHWLTLRETTASPGGGATVQKKLPSPPATVQAGPVQAVKPGQQPAVGATGLPTTVPGARNTITTGNTSKYVGEGRWDWSVFIVADDRTLQEIKCVEYMLHPTFPEPVRTVCERGPGGGKGFVLSSNGWGTFTVGVKITFADGEIRQLRHELQFASRAK